MSFFDNILGRGGADVQGPWKVLSSLEELETLIARSHEVPIAIFKHSISCGISAMVKAQLEDQWDLKGEEVELSYLDLIRHRDVSSKIAERLEVWHQSPQLILIKGGAVLYHASHQAIRVPKVKEAISQS